MNRRRTLVEVVLIFGCGVFFFFYRLAAFGLVGADEPRYAQIAREMLARHDWVTPILYGQPWMEKPPLYYWRAMLAFNFFGSNDMSARLPSATLALLLVVATYVWMRRFRPGAALDAAVMMASSAFIIAFSRAASTDMSLSAPFAIGMLCWFGWTATERRWWLIVFYIMMALGMLAKGPVAPFLAGAIIFAFAIAKREWKLVSGTLWVPGILMFLAIALPWYILVQRAQPDFFHVFILQHNLARFGTKVYRHVQPFWYYIPITIAAVMPWSVYVIAAIVDTISDWRFRLKNRQSLGDGLGIFLLLWIAIPVVFFSFSQSKLPGYILPAVPPCLVLAADYLHRKSEESTRPNFVLAAFHAALVAFLIAGLMLAPSQLVKAPAPVQALMAAAMIGVIVFIGVVLALFARGLPILRFATLVPVILGVAFILRTVAPVIDATQSLRPVAQKLESVGVDPKQTVATFKARREVEYGVAWYRNQPIKVYDRAEIPVGPHVVIMRAGSLDEMKELLPGREVKRVGDYPMQRLEFYSVSPAP